MTAEVSGPQWNRHDLLRVAPESWADAVANHPALADVPLVAGWVSHGWPVIVRRYADGEGRDRIPVALPLPPHLAKRRVAMTLPAGARGEHVAPVSLRKATRHAPASWQGTLRHLLALEASLGMTPRVFGALLWQHLTGLRYLHDGSDLDLLWAPGSEPVARRLVDRLTTIEDGADIVLDGEIETGDGGGVNWREFAAAAPDDTVLVKHLHEVRLQTVSSLFEGGGR